jgi:hypothetical protein
MVRVVVGMVIVLGVDGCSYKPLPALCSDPQPLSADCTPGEAGDGGVDAAAEMGDAQGCVIAQVAPIAPSIQLLIDRSGSMADNFNDTTPGPGEPTKYAALQEALVGAEGVVTQLEQQAYLGAALYSDDQQCPTLTSVARALGNRASINELIATHMPTGQTPTPRAIDATVQDFAAHPPPAGSPAVIVLATDGLPTACGTGTTTPNEAVAAAANAYAHGIPLFVLSVGNTAGTATHFQALANAGGGVSVGQANARVYSSSSPAELAVAFQDITRSALPCDIRLSGAIDASAAQRGQLTLNGTALTFGIDWALDSDRITLHLLGAACSAFKQSTNPTVEARFACGGTREAPR